MKILLKYLRKSMNILKDRLLIFVSVISLIFFVFIALDLSPFLRGPNDPIFESHWPYYFVNTINKIWLPLVISFMILAFYLFFEKRINKLNLKKELLFLGILVILVFVFQLALVYFSRFGIGILFRRIADPGINGYFTASLHIQNIPDFLYNYPRLLITSLPQHSRGDPPGPILFMYLFVNFFKSFPFIYEGLIKNLGGSVSDARNLWLSLLDHQKFAALFLGFFMHFISAFVLIPFYFLLKNLTNKIVALRGVFIFGLIPSFTFFPLFFDPLYVLFPILTFLFLVLGFKGENYKYYFLGGLSLAIGLFFNLAFLPLFLFLGILFVTIRLQERVKILLSFNFGLIVVPFLLLFAGYNSLYSGLVLLRSQTPRSYLDWVIYNPYDVFIFMGIPVSILFLIVSFKIYKSEKFNMLKKILISFWIMFISLVLSGTSRGEVGRIWIFLMIIPVGILAYFLTEKWKYSKVRISLLLLLLIIQCLVLEEFWVPIW